LPILSVKITLPSKKELTNISTFAKKVSTALNQVERIGIDENGDVTYGFSNSNAYIITALKDDTDMVWSTLISAITTDPLASTLSTSKKTLLYIDLRYGNKVFYKFGKYGSIATSTRDTLATSTPYDTRILAKPNR
jgi:hypothetical protein